MRVMIFIIDIIIAIAIWNLLKGLYQQGVHDGTKKVKPKKGVKK